MIPSKYQEDIWKFIEQDNRNLLINAVAGSGKSTTLINSLKFIPKGKDIIFTAFNKSIAEELRSRIDNTVAVSTLHSFGWEALRMNYNHKLMVDKDKVKKVIEKNITKWEILEKARRGYIFKIEKIVNFLRLTLSNDEEFERMCDKYDLLCTGNEKTHAYDTLQKVNSDTKSFDFTDMIYQPIRLNLSVKKYDFVFVDEAQDLSRVQQELVNKMKKRDGRLIAAGDEYQSIYGFAGGDMDSFNKLRHSPNTIELPLSISYRCDKTIIKKAQTIVEHIQYNNDSQEGCVRNGSVDEVRSGDFVLCRSTKPLVSLYIYLLKKGVKSIVKGKDFGKDLIALLVSTKTDNKKIANIKMENEIEKLDKKLTSYGIENTDKVTSMILLRERVGVINELIFKEVDNVSSAIRLIESIFQDTGDGVILSTIHRVKGLETDRVFMIRNDLIPNKFATQDWQLQQERNLEYVMYTRARHLLVTIVDWTDNVKRVVDKQYEII